MFLRPRSISIASVVLGFGQIARHFVEFMYV